MCRRSSARDRTRKRSGASSETTDATDGCDRSMRLTSLDATRTVFRSPQSPCGFDATALQLSIVGSAISIWIADRDGVFERSTTSSARPGAIYTAFSDEELRDLRETLGRLEAAETSFDFWDNPADARYDTL